MDIQVKDETAALNQCYIGKNQGVKQLNSAIDSLEQLLGKVKSNWQSSGMDKESYILELEKQIRNLRLLSGAALNFFDLMYKYLENVRNTRNQTIDGGSKYSTGHLEKVLSEDNERIKNDNLSRKQYLDSVEDNLPNDEVFVTWAPGHDGR